MLSNIEIRFDLTLTIFEKQHQRPNLDACVVLEFKGQTNIKIRIPKKLSPEFKGYEVYGALAGFSPPQEMISAATEQGYMVLKRKGQQITSHTPKGE